MSFFSRLSIGTANWGQEYNGVKVSEDDQKRILDYCHCTGITKIDTATAYGWDYGKADSSFEITLKLQKNDQLKRPTDNLAIIPIAHNAQEYPDMLGVRGVSLYDPNDIKYFGTSWPKIIQVPYSLYDRRFESRFLFPAWKAWGVQIQVRSIFLRGRILERATPQECISFCLMNPYVDTVIIGADSYKQFKENLDFLHVWNSMQCNDENIIDPRKWNEKEKK